MGYNIHIARVTGGNSTESSLGGAVNNPVDGRLQCQILPEMSDISESTCPWFPYFFRDKVLFAKGGELVWVICSDDFTVGYVLGLANYNEYSDVSGTFTGNSEKSEVALSVPNTLMEKVQTSLLDINLESISFQNTIVDFWNETSIHLTDKSTGAKVIAYSTGNIFIMRPDYFAIKIGNSKFTMDSNGISLGNDSESGDIGISAQHVGLGRGENAHLVVTEGSDASGAFVSQYVSV